MKDKLQFIISGSEVERYHTVRTLCVETVGHHSHQVALLCLLLAGCQTSKELLIAALSHDLAEHHLGDIPSPAKRHYGIGEQVNQLEEKLLHSVGLAVTLHPDDARTLKMADLAQGAIFCVREISMGNSVMKEVYSRYIAYAEAMIPLGRERELFNHIHSMYKEAI